MCVCVLCFFFFFSLALPQVFWVALGKPLNLFGVLFPSVKTATLFHLFVLPILITAPWGQGLSLIKQSCLYVGIPALVWPLGIQSNKTTSDNQSRQENNLPEKCSLVSVSLFL